jgi:8-oxo-dGTP pyrophosphatase MutT (NUDIX family)
VSFPRPEPGAELNHGEPTVPRQAATVMLVRGDTRALEVLLVRRTPKARFMAGAWVFPGGSVDPTDGDGPAGLRAAAIRELAEEAGVALAADAELLAFARWITPPEIKTRFDTWFFLAGAPSGAAPQVDGSEIVEFRWIRPGEALAASESGELFLVFPTIRQLRQLATFSCAADLFAHARERDVVPVQPRVIGSGEQARIALPGDPGYPA